MTNFASYVNLDMSIFLVFLAVNLGVGLYYGRRVKTIDDYALGGRDFSTAALVSTVMATFSTGSGLFITISNTYTDGLYYLIPCVGLAAQFLIVAYVFIPRMSKLLGALSVAEVMGNFYGKNVRIITAITAIIWIIGSLAVQFKVFGTMFTYFLGIDPVLSIIIAATITTVYSAFGGIRAVTYTDVLQFATFGFCIPVIGFIIWDSMQIKGIDFTAALNKPIFDFFHVLNPSNPGFMDMVLLTIYFTIPSLGPIHFQRISMGRNIQQIKRVFIISAALSILIDLAEAWIPFLLLSINPGLDPNNLVAYIINEYTTMGMKSLMIVGVAALAMSSADSFINGSAVLFGHDVCNVLNIKYNKLLLSKIFAVVLGVFGIFLAVSTDNLLSMIMGAASFYLPIVTVPLTATILGFRTTTKSVLIAMIVSFIMVVVWTILKIQTKVIVPALVINAIFLFGSHYLLRQPGGWVGNGEDEHFRSLKNLKKQKSYRIAELMDQIKNFNLLSFCIKTLPKSDLTYSLVGVFWFISTLVTIYASKAITIKEHIEIMQLMYQIMLIISSCFMLWVIWSPRLKNPVAVGVLWNASILYMFVFSSTFFLLLSDFGKLQLTLFTMHLMLLFVLTRWQTGIVMLCIGLSLAFGFYESYTYHSPEATSMNHGWSTILYILLVISSALITILKPIQDREEVRDKKLDHQKKKLSYQGEELQKLTMIKHEFLRNLEHELRTPITGITSMGQVLFDSYNKLSKKEIYDGLKIIAQSSTRLNSLVSSLLDLSKLSDASHELQIAQVDLSRLAFERLAACKEIYIDQSEADNREFIFDIKDKIFVNCDKYYISLVLDNIIINAIKYCQKGKITLTLEESGNRFIKFSVRDQGIGVPQNEIYDIFSEFTTSSYTKTPAGGRGIGLALCKKIIELHNGEIGAKLNPDVGTTFFFVIPK